MGHTRKNYPASFKAQLVLEMLREEKSVSELASEHGVHPTQLHRWRREAVENLPQLFARKEEWQAERAAYEGKVDELYTEIGRLTTRLTWLKKKGFHIEPG